MTFPLGRSDTKFSSKVLTVLFIVLFVLYVNCCLVVQYFQSFQTEPVEFFALFPFVDDDDHGNGMLSSLLIASSILKRNVFEK